MVFIKFSLYRDLTLSLWGNLYVPQCDKGDASISFAQLLSFSYSFDHINIYLFAKYCFVYMFLKNLLIVNMFLFNFTVMLFQVCPMLSFCGFDSYEYCILILLFYANFFLFVGYFLDGLLFNLQNHDGDNILAIAALTFFFYNFNFFEFESCVWKRVVTHFSSLLSLWVHF